MGILKLRLLPNDSTEVTVSSRSGYLNESLVNKIENFTLDTSRLRNCILREYQNFGAKFLLVRSQSFLGDEMGLGKTIQVLAMLTHLETTNPNLKALIVVPASLRENWKKEIEDKTEMQPFILHGFRFVRTLKEWQQNGGIAIVSYTTLRSKLEDYMTNASKLDVIVADEAQYIKKPSSQRSKATKEVARTAQYAVMMTGTPIENHPSEYFSILSALSHDNLAAQQLSIQDNLCTPERFKEVMADIYLRRNKEDVLDELPELNEISEKVSLGHAHLQEHLQLLEEVTHFMTLRQHAIYRKSGESRKLERVIELIDEYRANGENIVVFSYFKKVLAKLGSRYPDAGIIDGSVSSAERMKVIERFSAYSPTGNVLIGQISAAGVGLNMQAGSAVILVEPQLNPAIEYQAISRVHRMGQRNAVNVHRMHSIGTIEDGINDLLESKRTYMEQYARDSILKEQSSNAISNTEVKAITSDQITNLIA